MGSSATSCDQSASKPRILITGGSGFLGTNLVEALRQRAVVRNGDLVPPACSDHQDLFQPLDLLNAAGVKAAVADFAPEFVLHFAARTDLHGKTPADYAANDQGTENLLRALAEVGSVRRASLASTKLVCRNDVVPTDVRQYCPDTAYGESKVRMEQIVLAGDWPFEWCLVRPTSIWGEWFGVPYLDFFRAIAAGRYRHPACANAPKTFGYVGNTVRQVLGLLDAPQDQVIGQTFYLADYEPYRIGDWADEVARQLRGRPVGRIPTWVLRVAAWGGDALRATGLVKEPPMTSFRLRNMQTDTSGLPLANLQALVPDLPFTVAQGVERTLAWMRQQTLIA